MKYTAVVEEFATEAASYKKIVVFDAQDDAELDRLLGLYANGVDDKAISIDNSAEPEGFGYSGGFASHLISFTDETGRDVRHLEQGAF